MTDLISREAAIARIQALMEKEKFGSEFRIPFLDAIGAIADMPSAESELQEEIADLQSQLESWQHAAQYPRD